MSRSIIPRLGESAQRQVREKLSTKIGTKALCAPRAAVEFTMPIPPSVNHLFADGKGRRIKSSAYRSWWDATLQELVFIQKVPHLSGEVAIFAEIRRFSDLSDLSNRLKAMEDVIVAARIIDDDRFVLELHAKWSRTIPTCRVRIEPR